MTRLTSLDGSFLRLETPNAHMHVAWSGLFEPPAGLPRPTVEALQAKVATRLARVPRFRQRLAFPPLRLAEPSWVDDPQLRRRRSCDRAHRGRRAGPAGAVPPADRRDAVGAARPRTAAVAPLPRAAPRGRAPRRHLQDASRTRGREVRGRTGAIAVRPDARRRAGAPRTMESGPSSERRAPRARRVRQQCCRAVARGARHGPHGGPARRGWPRGNTEARGARVRAGPAALGAVLLPQRPDRPRAGARPPPRPHGGHRARQAARRARP